MCLFALSVAVRFVLASYPKVYHFFLDEQMYGSYAQSLLAAGTLEVQGLPMGFFRPVYSLLISFAYLLSDAFAQQVAVAFINVVVISSGIFAVYLLACRVLASKAYALLASALYICLSDFAYSQTWMTETAFLPLSLWTILAFWELENQKPPASSKRDAQLGALFGVLMGLCFMCKGGAALVFPIAYAGYLLIHAILLARSGAARPHLKHALFSLVAAAAGFAVVYAAFHALIPATLGDTSDASAKLSGLGEPADYIYSYYGIFYYLFAALVGLSFFPLTVTFQNRRRMEEDEAKLFDFLIISLLAMAAIVALTITLREDFLENAPRAHLRYITYLYMPLMLVFLRELRRKRVYSLKKNLVLAIAVAAILMLYLFAYGGQFVTKGEICDETTLKIFSGFETLQFFTVPAFIALLVAGTLLLAKNRRAFAVAMICALFAFNIANGAIASWIFRQGTQLSDAQQAKVYEFIELQQQNPDAKFLLIEGWRSAEYTVPIADTFANQEQTYYVDYEDFMTTYQENGALSWKDASAYLPAMRSNTITYPNMDRVDYIITGTQVDYAPREGEYTEKYEFPELLFTVYKLANSTAMPETDSRLNLVSAQGKTAEEIFDEAVREGKMTPEQREEFERQLNDAFNEDGTLK